MLTPTVLAPTILQRQGTLTCVPMLVMHIHTRFLRRSLPPMPGAEPTHRDEVDLVLEHVLVQLLPPRNPTSPDLAQLA